MKRAAILGGGIGGLSLAWFLAQRTRQLTTGPWHIEVFEQEKVAGGLVRGFEFQGQTFDQHYHCVLVTDRALRQLIDAVGLSEQVRFQVTRMGFYDGKRCIPFNNPMDLLRFPLLSPLDKARLITTILYCQHFGDVATLHEQALEPWLVGLGGRQSFERVWAPLLASKFDGDFTGMPATYLWSRLRRMQGTREKGGAVEKLGILKGGSSSLVRALAQRLPLERVPIHTGARVKALVPDGERTRVEIDGQSHGPFDLVLSTLPTPLHNRIAGTARAAASVAMPDRYLGIVDVVVALRRSLTPYYTLNLLDRSLPFTGIIETSHLMAPEDRGGVHLVYLPRYTDAQGPLYQQDNETLTAQFLTALRRMFPELQADDILATWVFKEPFVEPLHHQGGAYAPFPDNLQTGRTGVYLMNTGRLYPALHNCQAVVALADKTAQHVMAQHG